MTITNPLLTHFRLVADPDDEALRRAIADAGTLAYLAEPDPDTGQPPTISVPLADGRIVQGFVTVLGHLTTVHYNVIPAGMS